MSSDPSLIEGQQPGSERGFFDGFVKFCVVNLGAGVVDYGGLNLLLILFVTTVPTRIALYNAVSLLLANVFSYFWNTLWTFRSSARHDLRQISRYAAQAVMSVVVAGAVIWLSSGFLFDNTSLAPILVGDLSKILSSIVVTILSFLFLRHLVFEK